MVVTIVMITMMLTMMQTIVYYCQWWSLGVVMMVLVVIFWAHGEATFMPVSCLGQSRLKRQLQRPGSSTSFCCQCTWVLLECSLTGVLTMSQTGCAQPRTGTEISLCQVPERCKPSQTVKSCRTTFCDPWTMCWWEWWGCQQYFGSCLVLKCVILRFQSWLVGGFNSSWSNWKPPPRWWLSR